jgi:hypothetical protein
MRIPGRTVRAAVLCAEGKLAIAAALESNSDQD